jgi:hypothetical protein
MWIVKPDIWTSTNDGLSGGCDMNAFMSGETAREFTTLTIAKMAIKIRKHSRLSPNTVHWVVY